MTKAIKDFAKRFGTRVTLKQGLIMKKQGRYFLLNENVERLNFRDFFYAGTYLGKVKNRRFFPSFNLLDIISRQEANKVFVDRKTEWLFICGRDVFTRGITRVNGSTNKGDYVLVLNRRGECLGFGRMLSGMEGKPAEPAVRNILDVGDLLRRER